MNSLRSSVGIVIPAAKVSVAMVLVTLGLLLLAQLLNFIPQQADFELQARKKVSESLAIQLSLLAPVDNYPQLKNMVVALSNRNADILSSGIRLENGALIYAAGNHKQLWADYRTDQSTPTHVIVPVFQNDERWGQVEIYFSPLNSGSLENFYYHPFFKLAVFTVFTGFLIFFIFMLRIMRQLDPSAVVPERVNAAFDTLAEGVLILDEKQQIVLANKSLAEKLNTDVATLTGKKISELNWSNINSTSTRLYLPWSETLVAGKSVMGFQIRIRTDEGEKLKFALNCSPIKGEDSAVHGVLITLDDITQLEERNVKLKTLVENLKESQTQIQKKNSELKILATRDSLTGSYNRRAFNEYFQNAFFEAEKQNSHLVCIMADIDHFKSVNDNFGHGIGDEVIKLLAEVMQDFAGDNGFVGRYGGEEFCMIISHKDLDDGVAIAEKIRINMKEKSVNNFTEGLRVTVSLGVASIIDKPVNYAELNKWADDALYMAKESGRNKVVGWLPELLASKKATESVGEATVGAQSSVYTPTVDALNKRIVELEDLATNFCFELEYSKLYDSLTGLPNQLFFIDRLKQVVDRGDRSSLVTAVLIIDVGMQDSLNSFLNRKSSDLLLKSISERMSGVIRKYDIATQMTFSRFGDNEFSILLTDIANKDAITWIVKRLLDSFADPVKIDSGSVYLTCYIGISVFTTEGDADGSGVDDLVNAALIAKQNCKKSESNLNYLFFDPFMHQESVRIMQLDSELRIAVAEQQWQLVYQPKVDLTSQKIVGVEALIRWNHPQRGLLTPNEFIEFSEARGFILDIGDWVIEEACRQLSEWEKIGITDCTIAVNLSPLQVKQEDFVEKILHTLKKYKVAPRNLELEVTENMLMKDIRNAMNGLQKLSLLGMQIAVDDFGTGYSSLNYLKRLPINILKIDRTFITDFCNDQKDENIVNSLIVMAHSMGLVVVAEGVEDRRQLLRLTELSCNQVQGYLISKPVSADEILQILTSFSMDEFTKLPETA